MKSKRWLAMVGILVVLLASMTYAAYHHEGEKDTDKFLSAYPGKAGTKLDHCGLCHTGGSYTNNKGQLVSIGSCQWCHDTYGYDGAGDISETMNVYGVAYKAAGRNADAVAAIDDLDSDGDGYSNKDEIAANRFPGNAADHPGLVAAPSKVYTRQQLEALPSHTQFMLMNTSRSGDYYARFTGVPMKDLLDDAGILPTATGITVYAPDGWSQYHPLSYDASLDMYHVYGNETGQNYQYPPATYYYDQEADVGVNPDTGWCDYSAPSCTGRSHGSAINVSDGLKAILAYQQEGIDLETGILNDENKLDGAGPYRVVVPQKFPNAPDQSSKSDDQNVKWPYVEDWDHNAGSCTRSVTIIRVEPLPEGTTDIDVVEAAWNYIDEEKIVIYGAISGTANDDDADDTGDTGGDDDDDDDDDGFGCLVNVLRR